MYYEIAETGCLSFAYLHVIISILDLIFICTGFYFFFSCINMNISLEYTYFFFQIVSEKINLIHAPVL